MTILCTETFEKQLKELLEEFAEEDLAACKNFKMYLDTIILNMPTKVQKFKKSIYFDDENIKDIEHRGLLMPFYIDEENDAYLILGIVKNKISS
jgi:hypothetical protein